MTNLIKFLPYQPGMYNHKSHPPVSDNFCSELNDLRFAHLWLLRVADKAYMQLINRVSRCETK